VQVNFLPHFGHFITWQIISSIQTPSFICSPNLQLSSNSMKFSFSTNSLIYSMVYQPLDILIFLLRLLHKQLMLSFILTTSSFQSIFLQNRFPDCSILPLGSILLNFTLIHYQTLFYHSFDIISIFTSVFIEFISSGSYE